MSANGGHPTQAQGHVSSGSDVLHPQILKSLTDKLYEKRKSAALEIEKVVRESLLAGDHSRIQGILQLLVQDFAYSAVANSRNGGLIALAAVAIALGTSEVGKYLEFIAPPILACFHDHDSRVRYYACESMYNVSKVSRGSILIYFNPIFDALSKLATDPEISVKNGAELLDRLIKDIVSEKSLFSTTKVGRPTGNELSGLPAVMQVPGTVLLPGSNMSFFNMERFIPLLAERIQVMAPATRLFLVNWISVLDSVPDLELIGYLPEFLDGLFTYLSDVHSDVRIATLNVLGEFLKEIRDVVEIQREKGYLHDRRFQSPLGAELVEKRKSTLSLDQQMSESLSLDEPPQVPSKGVSQTDKEEGHGDLYVPGQGVALDFGKMTKIIQPHLNSLDEETQATALRWINEFISMARELMLPFTTLLINAILPSLSHPVSAIRSIAVETNNNLYRLVYDSTSDSLSVTSSQVMANLSTLSTPTMSNPLPPSVQGNDQLEIVEAVVTLVKHFQAEHEETRIAALDWLLMLHKNAPVKFMSAEPNTVKILLKNLSDHSEEVVKRDLQLLAQISHHSDAQYFTQFMVHLLNLFSTDRKLLEARGSLIIRQLCHSLDPERMYRTFAEVLEKDEDIEFASLMVQNLNIILITAPELLDIRKRLKNIEFQDNSLFVVLYKCWSHNPVALFSLCLLASAYEHAVNLLQILAEMEITVSLLIQLDKLVQLLESPVFTYLRLQLLEPGKYPHLFKCLYGILMLLPQSSAFATLRNRLNSVNSLVTLNVATGSVPVQTSGGSKRPQSKQGGSSSPDTDSHLIWWQDLLQHFRSVQEKHEKNRKVAVRPFPAMEKTQAKHRSSRGSRILASSGQSEESGSDTVPPKEKRVSSLGFGTKFSTKGSSSQSASMRGLSRKA